MQLLRWNNPGERHQTASSLVRGAGCRGPNPRLRRREKNVLDMPLYRSGVAIENSFPKSAKTDLRRVAKTFFEPPGNEVLETRIAGRSDQTSTPIDRIN